MKQQIPLYLLIAGTGVIIGLLLQRPVSDTGKTEEPAEQQQTSPKDINTKIPEKTNNQDNTQYNSKKIDVLNTQVDDLFELIDQETKERKQLAQEVSTLKTDIARLTTPDPDERRLNSTRTYNTSPRNTNAAQGKWFNDQALINAGVDTTEATRIRQLYEDVEMKKLYLRDQAIRDGTIGSQDYQNKRAELDNQLGSLREELGEDVYDAYLYAAGQPNRVVVLSALKNSPANQAGMQPGDTILRYDNQRIFTWTDLRTATAKGDLNTTVLIEVMRDGKPVSIYVPRGPLGIQLDNSSDAP